MANKHREYSRDYYWSHREQCVQKARDYRQKYPDRVKVSKKRYYEQHSKELNEKRKRSRWKTLIDTSIDGVRVRFKGLNKRDRPDKCEICGKQKRILHYHHWDDLKPELGLWVCRFCHIGISVYEDGRIDLYLKKKEEIEAQTAKSA